MAGLPTSREPALILRAFLWAALSALFTLAVVQYSLRHGRLIRLPTYDDVAYMCDGLERLEILYHDGYSVPLNFAPYVNASHDYLQNWHNITVGWWWLKNMWLDK